MPDLRNAQWRTSSHSLGGKACVEVADLPDGHRAVRDSKDQSGPALTFTATEWAVFTVGVRTGEFD
jgi:uncharacterized protein DUF397